MHGGRGESWWQEIEAAGHIGPGSRETERDG